MESSLGLLLVLIVIIHSIVQAQDQEAEFISLDCGLPANELSPYNEGKTGLSFESDKKYIQSGRIGVIEGSPNTGFLKPYETLRYFPNGTRNCYNIDVKKRRKYLIRATFVYGNYDGLHINPKFDLYLGPNRWATIDLETMVGGTLEDILHIPTSNTLQVCLIKTGKTTPLISSLELRPIWGTRAYFTGPESLRLFAWIYLRSSGSHTQIRRDISKSLEVSKSNSSGSELRNSGDIYDRIWESYFQTEWTEISTTLNVDNTNEYKVPEDALKHAATPTNASAPLTIEWSSENLKDQYYYYAHFSEIQDLQANETREFDLLWNGVVVSREPVKPRKLQIDTVARVSMPLTCDEGECSFQLKRTNKSTLPPLLNAIELYTVIQFSQSETDESDVVAMKSITATYGLMSRMINWQGDPCFPLQLRWDGLNCTHTDNSAPPRITSLNLSSVGLTGNIAAAIQNLTQLEKLDLSNNSLTGELPEFLGNIKSLLFINLSGNDFNGSIPQSLKRKGVKLLHDGNPRLCPTGSCTKRHRFPVAIVASVAPMAILIAAVVLFLVLRKKKLWTVEGSSSPNKIIKMRKKRFAYSEVIEMTNNFQRVLGKGGFGEVYYGTLNDFGQVAVKVCFGTSTHGVRQFKAEVDLLLRVHHTNLVSLIGYCDEEDHLALIYEFVPNGDLKEHLSGKQGRPIIDWGMRLKIAVEAALGLEYLHIGCTPSMIHRDVKTSNILLGENFQAKLADFGLSRSSPVAGENHVSTVVAGTYGYLDPEYHETGWLSEKSDVYSFGVVLLEMITNKPVIDETREKPNIAQWVRFEVNRGEITRIMDPNLGVDYNSPCVWSALELAMSCADPSSTERPTMSQVVIKLKECLEKMREASELL